MQSSDQDSNPNPTSTASTSSLKLYLKNYSNFFPHEKNPETLLNHLTNENLNLHTSKFRSIYWRCYLGCFSNKRSNWINESQIYRQIYKDLKDKHLPVSDEQLILNVRQDVRRTMPDKKIFREEKVQDLMTEVLIIWSIASPCGKRLSYRQGIHELLAPMLFVLMADHATFNCMKDIAESDQGDEQSEDSITLPEDLTVILDPEYLAADSFLMLCRLMFYIEPWYGTNQLFKQLKSQEAQHNYDQSTQSQASNDQEKGEEEEFDPEPKVPNSIAALLDGRMSRNEEDFTKEHIDIKLERIHNLTLNVIDTDLCNHLKFNDIIPQVYGIRWLRLLFGREFSHEDSLEVWDYLFSHLMKFDDLSGITDLFFVAMLVNIKPQLMAGGEQACVTHLMKYPKVGDISKVVDLTKNYLGNYKNLEDRFLKQQQQNSKKNSNSSSNPRNSIKKTINGLLASPDSSLSQKSINANFNHLKGDVKSSLDYFTKDVTSSLSDWKLKLNKAGKNWGAAASISASTSSSSNTPTNDVKSLCANELSFCIDRLQKIIYEETDDDVHDQNSQDPETENRSETTPKNKDNDNLAEMCLILANLKHTRDVLKGILPVSSLGQLNG